MIGIETYIPATVGSMSLIGVGKERPCSWGNYFWFTRAFTGGPYEGIRCCNMWAENLKTAATRFLPDGMVKVVLFKGEHCDYAIVVDERIPKEWRYDKCCFTGCYRPSYEIAKEIYDILGDPDGEFEWWTDPGMYHAKRCEEIESDKEGKSYWIRVHPRTEENRQRLINKLLEERAK